MTIINCKRKTLIPVFKIEDRITAANIETYQKLQALFFEKVKVGCVVVSSVWANPRRANPLRFIAPTTAKRDFKEVDGSLCFKSAVYTAILLTRDNIAIVDYFSVVKMWGLAKKVRNVQEGNMLIFNMVKRLINRFNIPFDMGIDKGFS